MSSGFGQAGFRLAFFIIFVAGLLLLVTPRGTAEFYITVLTFLIGLTFAGIIMVMVRFLK